ncbi:hypothetical protein T03_3807 [Trichinella britovi]|uniref:Uncharacterized protein n=1 Tax=Trichinella britovi TaxID=45882 RepID=A0A0V0YUM8_TRIBR|nr:hypothetical protein T03_3807 [Trichinella britovi]
MFLPPCSLVSNRRVSFVNLLSGILRVVPLHMVGVYHQCAAIPPLVPNTIRLRAHSLHNLVWPLSFTVELPSSWHRKPHAVVRSEA